MKYFLDLAEHPPAAGDRAGRAGAAAARAHQRTFSIASSTMVPTLRR